jgi:hypothetical protein
MLFHPVSHSFHQYTLYYSGLRVEIQGAFLQNAQDINVVKIIKRRGASDIFTMRPKDMG